MLKTAPTVFAVGNEYQIMVSVNTPCLFRVTVGNHSYYDHSNGILRSMSDLHRVHVPMDELDRTKAYTVYVRPIIERKPYFTETEEECAYRFAFRPVPAKYVRAYHISDAHNRIEAPLQAANAFGNIDLLILNGDILDHAGDPSKFDNVYTLCSAITKGEFPVVFSRGNHDMRGNFAEAFAQYTPNDHGATYYRFRLGSIWGVVLDCAEDKPDDHAEYGHTVVCHAFRKQQTAFLKELIQHADTEYQAEGVDTRLVICHNPFVKAYEPPFDIEHEVYSEWASLLSEHIQPHAMLCGHLHQTYVQEYGEERDIPFPCPLIVGSRPDGECFTGCGVVFNDNNIEVVFTDDSGQISETEIIYK